MDKVCQFDGLKFQLVPAGISRKTGKQYGAFWSCPSRNMTHNINIEQAPSIPPTQNMPVPPPQISVAGPDSAIQLALNERELRIARESCLSTAAEVMSAHSDSLGLTYEESIQKVITEADKLVKYVYEGLPNS